VGKDELALALPAAAQKGAGQQLGLRCADAAGPAELGEGLARCLLQARRATACCFWPARSVSVFKPLDLHGRYPQQGRRWGSP
jgi:hypothetical protein